LVHNALPSCLRFKYTKPETSLVFYVDAKHDPLLCKNTEIEDISPYIKRVRKRKKLHNKQLILYSSPNVRLIKLSDMSCGIYRTHT
jgi:hypothetical protein